MKAFNDATKTVQIQDKSTAFSMTAFIEQKHFPLDSVVPPAIPLALYSQNAISGNLLGIDSWTENILNKFKNLYVAPLKLLASTLWWFMLVVQNVRCVRTVFENHPKCRIGVFQKIVELDLFWRIFNELFSTQNVVLNFLFGIFYQFLS